MATTRSLTIDKQGLRKLVTEFKKVFPDFKSFEDSGDVYQWHEDTWKRRASSNVQARLRRDSDVWSRSELFIGALNDMFTKEARKLALTDQFSGIAWNNDKDTLLSNGTGARRLSEATRRLLFGGDRLLTRVEGVEEAREKLSLETSLWKLTTLPLMLVHPTHFAFVKPREFANAFETVGLERHLKPTPEGVVRTQSFATAVKKNLPGLLAEPRDMIDVQSFIWVAAGTYKTRPARLPKSIAALYQARQSGEVDDDEQIVKAMKTQREVSAFIRNAKWVKRLKSRYRSTCQISEDHILNTPSGDAYAEVHHVRGVADGGPLHIHPGFGNEVVVCPNCHALFSVGAICIDPRDGKTIRHYQKHPGYEGKKLRFDERMGHVLDPKCTRAAVPAWMRRLTRSR